MRAVPNLIAVLLALFACTAAARPSSAVPPVLDAWRGWVLHGHEALACPQPADRPFDARAGLCAWPGELSLDVDATGARFSLEWSLEIPAWVELPGSAELMPQNVRAESQTQPVLLRGGRPALRLSAGRHRLQGEFLWSRRPESLALPRGVVRLALQVDGRRIDWPERQGDRLWLGREGSAAEEADALELRVFRQLEDGQPIRLSTRIELYGSGRLREERLPQVLPEGFVALAMDSDWPARLEPDGSLRVQVSADDAVIELEARALGWPERIQRPAAPEPWPEQEIWSWRPALELRDARLLGGVEVDPRRADLPEEWWEHPAYTVGPGQSLQLEERSRGEGAAGGNRLRLQRQLWLDHDGAGFSLLDRLRGDMRERWRLEALPPLRLEAARDHEGAPQLLTRLGDAAAVGLEWRYPEVALDAELRVEGRHLPLGGWDQSFESVALELHLPAGWRLLAAPGAEPGRADWLSRWRLLDVFLVAVLGLLAWHALGATGAAASAGLLVLGWHEPGLPVLAFGLALASVLLVRALPQGRLQHGAVWLQRGAVLLLVLMLLPFAVLQARLALYPQLQAELQGASRAAALIEEQAVEPLRMPSVAAPAPPSPASMAAVPRDLHQGQSLDRIEVTGSRIRTEDTLQGHAESTVMQAGRGLPRWRAIPPLRLQYAGPIAAEEPLRLWLLSPALQRLLRLGLLLLAGLLVWQLLGRPRLPRRAAMASSPALASALLLPLLLAAAPLQAQSAAALPSPELLDGLRQRLLEAPDCSPACARIARMQVLPEGERLRLRLEVHARTRSALPLPMPESPEQARLLQVSVAGASAPGPLADGARSLLAVPAGVQTVELLLEPRSARLRLQLPLQPARVELGGEDWQLAGLDDSGRPLSGTLLLQRAERTDAASGTDGESTQRFADFVSVHRRLTFDTQWSVYTTVSRLAPERGDIALDLPLLAGERVSSSEVQVREGRVHFSLDDDQHQVGWHSQLDRRTGLELVAEAADHYVESWKAVVGPIWRVQFSGLPESGLAERDARDYHRFLFHPRPGERLQLQIAEPASAGGGSLALEQLRIDSRLGPRQREHRIDLELRSTVGGEHRLQLPEGTELVSLRRDGELLRLPLQAGALGLPLRPGLQRYQVELRELRPLSGWSRGLEFDPGLPAVNVHQRLELPAQRWTLWTSGPRQGPAVLYWGELCVLLLLALAFARVPASPLKAWQWLLLALGFSAVSLPALLLVAAWLFALGARRRSGPEAMGVWFNPAQVALVLLTALALVALLVAVPMGLLGQPEMQVLGNGSSASTLVWYSDRTEATLPAVAVLSAPMWLYRALMLLWALWLAVALMGWLKLALQAWTAGGYWRPWRRRPPPVPESARPGPESA